MQYRTFVLFNLSGAFSWGVGLTLVGFLLGQIEFVAKYSEFFIIGIVLLSGVPCPSPRFPKICGTSSAHDGQCAGPSQPILMFRCP